MNLENVNILYPYNTIDKLKDSDYKTDTDVKIENLSSDLDKVTNPTKALGTMKNLLCSDVKITTEYDCVYKLQTLCNITFGYVRFYNLNEKEIVDQGGYALLGKIEGYLNAPANTVSDTDERIETNIRCMANESTTDKSYISTYIIIDQNGNIAIPNTIAFNQICDVSGVIIFANKNSV